MPTTNFNAIMKNRAALVYAIQKKKLDIGLIIHNSIIHGFQIVIQGFAHPNLITELCQQTGVKWNNKDVRAPKAIMIIIQYSKLRMMTVRYLELLKLVLTVVSLELVLHKINLCI